MLEQWLDDYWRAHVKDSPNVLRLEQIVHDLVFMLLEVGDDQLSELQAKDVVSPLTGKPLSSYEPVKDKQQFKKTHIMIHQDHINTVMMAIKPGYLRIYCQKYSKEMVLNYLSRVRSTDVIAYGFGESKQSQRILKLITSRAAVKPAGQVAPSVESREGPRGARDAIEDM